MPNKTLALILAAAMLLPTLSACGGGETGAPAGESVTTGNVQPETSASEVTTAKPTAYDRLPKADYKGYTFSTITSDSWSVDMKNQLWVEAETGDVINDAVYARNRNVEDKFNVKIGVKTIKYADLAAGIQTDVQSGDGAYDLAVHSPTKLGPLTAEKIFLDAASLEYIHLDEPWYSQAANEEMSIGGKQYIFHSDMGFVWASTVIAVLFNRTMAEKYKLEDMYALALSGGWTLDKMISLSKGITEDLDGDGVLNEKDKFGMAIDLGEYLPAFMFGSDIRVTRKDASGAPKLSLSSEKTTKFIDKMHAYLYNKDLVFITTGNVANADHKTPQTIFHDGRSLFMNKIVGSTNTALREMEDNYGVLPMPKYDDKQDMYYTAVAPGSTTVFAIPMTTKDKERTAVLTDALAYEGHELVVPALIEQALKVKYSRDDKSSVVYDLIFDGAILDFGTIFDKNNMSIIFRTLMRENSTDFASKYSSLEAASAAEYDRVWKLFAE